MNDLDKHLLNDFQRDFPLVPRPFAAIAERLGVSEDAVIAAYGKLSDEKMVSRIGAIVAPNRVGASTLAAMAVPEAQLETVAGFVSSFAQVNHNYEREHAINLWFVVAANDSAEVDAVIDAIEAETGFAVLNLPIIEDYHLDLVFQIQWTD